MDTISYTAVRANLARIMDKVCDDHAPVIVTRQKAREVVLLSLSDYRALEETAYLLRTSANAARLAGSIADIASGRVGERQIEISE